MSAQSLQMCPSTHAAPRLRLDWNPSNFRCIPCTPSHPFPHIPATARRMDWDCIPISAAAVQDLPGGGGGIAPSLSEAALIDEVVVAAIVDVVVPLALPSPARNQEHIPPVAVPSQVTTTHKAMRRKVSFACLWLSASWLLILRSMFGNDGGEKVEVCVGRAVGRRAGKGR